MEAVIARLKSKSIAWDWVGVGISILCIIHCVLIGLLFILYPVGISFFPEEDWTHVVMLSFVLGVAGIAFISGYRKHKKIEPVLWMILGVALVSFAAFFVHDLLGHSWEPLFAIAGGAALIRAHILNHHCRKCEVAHENH